MMKLVKLLVWLNWDHNLPPVSCGDPLQCNFSFQNLFSVFQTWPTSVPLSGYCGSWTTVQLFPPDSFGLWFADSDDTQVIISWGNVRQGCFLAVTLHSLPGVHTLFFLSLSFGLWLLSPPCIPTTVKLKRSGKEAVLLESSLYLC